MHLLWACTSLCGTHGVCARHGRVHVLWQVLQAMPDAALLYILLSVVLGAAMHDHEAAYAMGITAGDGLASVNGVGGGLWQVNSTAPNSK